MALVANCTQNTNVDLGLSLILTALCRAKACLFYRYIGQALKNVDFELIKLLCSAL